MKTKNQILQDQPKFNFTPPPYILDPKFYDFLFQNCSLKRLKNESSPRPYPFFFLIFPPIPVCFKGFLLFAFPGWKSTCISHLSHVPYFCVALLKICVKGLRIQSKFSEYQISESRIKLKISVIRHRSVNHSAPSFVSK